MKKQFLAFSISLLSILMVSCNSKGDQIKQIDYQIDERTGGVEALPTISAEAIPTITPAITPRADEPDYWSFLSNFQGIKSEAETPSAANLEINMKQDNSIPCLVCPDPKNNTVYYINYGKDYYIYELKEDTSTLLVDKMANYIQLWGGYLYFLGYKDDRSITYDDFFMDSKSIYRFNLKSKELELLLDTNAASLYVNSEGVFYQYREYSEDQTSFNVYGYRLDFNSNTPQKIDRMLFATYKNYYLKGQTGDPDIPGDLGRIFLHNNNTGEEITVMQEYRSNRKISIYNDTLFYARGVNLYSLNLTTGKGGVYDMTKAEAVADNSGFDKSILYSMLSSYQRNKNDIIISDYTVFQNEIYIASFAGYLIKIKSDGKIQLVPIMDENKHTIYNLYTSGNRLFALGGKYIDNKNYREMIELIVTGDEITAKNITQ